MELFSLNRIMRNVFTLACFVLLTLQATYLHAAQTVVISLDPIGEGTQDTSVVSPVEGNSATSLGQQRTNVITAAANKWISSLHSDVPIQIQVSYENLTCNADEAVLAAAGPTSLHARFSDNLPTDVYYSSALANALAGYDIRATEIFTPDTAEISIVINANLNGQDDCLGGVDWYLGLDDNTPQGQISLYTVLLHEMGHGLGISSFIDYYRGDMYKDSYSSNIIDEQSNELLTELESYVRIEALKSGQLVWKGEAASLSAFDFTSGTNADNQFYLYSPDPVEFGSSVNHLSPQVEPDELMEPFFTGYTDDLSLSLGLLEDIGWRVFYPRNGENDPGKIKAKIDEIVDDEDRYSYLLSQSFKTVFRWDSKTGAYLSAIDLDHVPDAISLSLDGTQLFSLQTGGDIYVIDLTKANPKQLFLGSSKLSNCDDIVATEQGIVLCGIRLVSYTGEVVFSKPGTLDQVGFNISSEFSIWSEADKRVYGLLTNSSRQVAVLEFLESQILYPALPNHNRSYSPYKGPILISDDGTLMLSATGAIFDTSDMKAASAAIKEFDHAVWTNSAIVTATQHQNQFALYEWDSQFNEIKTLTVQGKIVGMSKSTQGLIIWGSQLGIITPYFYQVGSSDSDGDGIADAIDPIPLNSSDDTNDADEDGIPDVLEQYWGMNPNDAADASADWDNDGLTNLEEHQFGTHLNDSDSDKDGLLDSEDDKPTSFSILVNEQSTSHYSSIQGDSAYILFEQPGGLKIFDLITQTTLRDVAISESPQKMIIDDQIIYIQTERAIYRFDLQGNVIDTLYRSDISFVSGFSLVDDKAIISTQREYISLMVDIHTKKIEIFEFGQHGLNQSPPILEDLQTLPNSSIVVGINKSSQGLSSLILNESKDQLIAIYDGEINNNELGDRLYMSPDGAYVLDSNGSVFKTNQGEGWNIFDGSIGSNIDDLEFFDDGFVRLNDNILTRFDSQRKVTLQVAFCQTPLLIDVYNQQILLYYLDNNQLKTSVLTDEFIASQIDCVTTGTTKYNNKLVEFGTNQAFVVDNRALKLTVWDLEDISIRKTLSLQSPVREIKFSAQTNYLFVAYYGDQLHRINIDTDTQTSLLVNTPLDMCGFEVVNNSLVVCQQFHFNLYDFDGQYLGYSEELSSFGTERIADAELTWSETLQRLYYSHQINDCYSENCNVINDLTWFSLLSDSNEFGHGTSVGLQHVRDNGPLYEPFVSSLFSLNEKANRLLLSNGQIVNPLSLEIIEQLSTTQVVTGFWLNNKLITAEVSAQNSVIKGFDEQFDTIWQQTLEGEILQLDVQNDQLWAVIENNNKLTISNISSAIPDSDGDQINDLVDTCWQVSNPNAQTDTDKDGIGDVCDSDDDNDGIEDIDEINLGLESKYFDDGLEDSDGDGFLNTSEIRLGSDMHDASSKPQVTPSGYAINIQKYSSHLVFNDFNHEVQFVDPRGDIVEKFDLIDIPSVDAGFFEPSTGIDREPNIIRLKDSRLLQFMSNIDTPSIKRIRLYDGTWRHFDITLPFNVSHLIEFNGKIYASLFHLVDFQYTGLALLELDLSTQQAKVIEVETSIASLILGKDNLFYMQVSEYAANSAAEVLVVDPQDMLAEQSCDNEALVGVAALLPCKGKIKLKDIYRFTDYSTTPFVFEAVDWFGNLYGKVPNTPAELLLDKNGKIIAYNADYQQGSLHEAFKISHNLLYPQARHCVYSVFSPNPIDQDGDTLPDCMDIAPLDPTLGFDTDLDGTDDRTDADIDNDDVANALDNCLFTVNPKQNDLDQDGVGDLCDDNIDGDWMRNEVDFYPTGVSKLFNEAPSVQHAIVRTKSDLMPFEQGAQLVAEYQNRMLFMSPSSFSINLVEKNNTTKQLNSYSLTVPRSADYMISVSSHLAAMNEEIIAIGYPDSSGSVNSGAVYLYRMNNAEPYLDQVIKSPNLEFGNGFFGDVVRLSDQQLFVNSSEGEEIVGSSPSNQAKGLRYNDKPQLGYIHIFSIENDAAELVQSIKSPLDMDYSAFGEKFWVTSQDLVASQKQRYIAEGETHQDQHLHIYQNDTEGLWQLSQSLSYSHIVDTVLNEAKLFVLHAPNELQTALKTLDIYLKDDNGNWQLSESLPLSSKEVALIDWDSGSDIIAIRSTKTPLYMQNDSYSNPENTGTTASLLKGTLTLLEQNPYGDWIYSDIDGLDLPDEVGKYNEHPSNHWPFLAFGQHGDFKFASRYPTWVHSFDVSLDAVFTGDIDAGASVSSLFSPHFKDKNYADSLVGIAIVGAAGSSGWQYRMGESDTWQNVPALATDENALILSKDAWLRPIDITSAELAVRLWDGEGQILSGLGQNIVQLIGNSGGFSLQKLGLRNVLDQDKDGLPDRWELEYGLNPNDGADAILDLDSDGLSNLQEFDFSTRPDRADTDNDGLLDKQEVIEYNSNPKAADSDGDGIVDSAEIKLSFNINVSNQFTDQDGDGYSDLEEYLFGSSPNLYASKPRASAWSTFQGNNKRSGYSPILTNSESFRQVWQKQVEQKMQQAVISADMIYLTAALQCDHFGLCDHAAWPELVADALSLTTGERKWRKDYKRILGLSQPALLNDTVHFFVNAEYGPIEVESASIEGGFEGYSSSGERLYHTSINDRPTQIAAPKTVNGLLVYEDFEFWIDPRTGLQRFDGVDIDATTSLERKAGRDSANIFKFVQTSVINSRTFLSNDSLQVFNAHTGQAGSVIIDSSIRNDSYPYYSPVVEGDFDNAFVVNNHRLVSFDLSKKARSWVLEGQYSALPVTGNGMVYVLNEQTIEAVEQLSGKIIWQYELNEALYGAPLLSAKHLFIATKSQVLALALNTQQIEWQYSIEHADLAMAKNGYLVLSGQHEVTVFNTLPTSDFDDDGTFDSEDLDDDNDAIPDEYEIAHDMDPLDAADANRDRDADQLSNLQEYVLGTDINNVDTDDDGIPDNVDSNPLVFDEVYKGQLTVLPDMTGDGIQEIGIFNIDSEAGKVTLTILNGKDRASLDEIIWSDNFVDESLSLHLIPDMNSNGFDEVGLFGVQDVVNNAGKPQIFVRDLKTGNRVSVYNWPANWTDVSALVLSDISGDGIAEIGLQGRFKDGSRPQLVVKNGASGSAEATYSYPNLFTSPVYFQHSDANGDGFEEIATFGRITRNNKIQIRIANGINSGNKMKAYNFPDKWDNVSWHRLDDSNGDGIDDWGLFGISKIDGRPQLINKDGTDPKGALRLYAWPGEMQNAQFFRIPDMNNDGVDDVAAAGRRSNNGRYQFQVKDGTDRNAVVANHNLNLNLENVSYHVLPDLSGDEKAELGFMGINPRGEYELVIRHGDTANGEYATHNLGSDWESAPAITSLGDTDDDGLPDLLIYGQNASGEQLIITPL